MKKAKLKPPTKMLGKMLNEFDKINRKLAKNNIFVNALMHGVALDAALQTLEEFITSDMQREENVEEIVKLRSGLDEIINVNKYMGATRYHMMAMMAALKDTAKYSDMIKRAEKGEA